MSEIGIKDSGTMAKYWKNLLELNFISRNPRIKDGVHNGYDYSILDYPIVDQSGKNPIREKPDTGKTPN